MFKIGAKSTRYSKQMYFTEKVIKQKNKMLQKLGAVNEGWTMKIQWQNQDQFNKEIGMFSQSVFMACLEFACDSFFKADFRRRISDLSQNPQQIFLKGKYYCIQEKVRKVNLYKGFLKKVVYAAALAWGQSIAFQFHLYQTSKAKTHIFVQSNDN